MGGYLLRLLCASLICGICTRLTQSSGCKEIIRLLCGVFLTIVLVQPICRINWENTMSWAQDWEAQASEIVRQGTQNAETQRRSVIKAQLEAYIITKAKEENAAVCADVTIGEDLLPQSVIITGALSPAAKTKLKQLLTQELGIPEVRQQWNG